MTRWSQLHWQLPAHLQTYHQHLFGSGLTKNTQTTYPQENLHSTIIKEHSAPILVARHFVASDMAAAELHGGYSRVIKALYFINYYQCLPNQSTDVQT